MDLFAVPRTTFTLYLRLVQFPFEVGMRLLGRGDDDGGEAAAVHADAAVRDEQARGSSKPGRQRAPRGGRRAASRRGQAGSRPRQARRRGQAQRETAASQREKRERPTDASARGETAAGEIAEDVQQRIEAARGAAAASQRETPERADEEATNGGDEQIQDQRHGHVQVSSAVKVQTP